MKCALLLLALLTVALSVDEHLPRLFLFTHSVSSSHLGFVFKTALKVGSTEVYDVRWPMTESVKSYAAPKHFKTIIFDRGLSISANLTAMMDEVGWKKGGGGTIKMFGAAFKVAHLMVLPCDFEDTIEYDSASSNGTESANLALIDTFTSWCAVPRARELDADYIFVAALQEPASVSIITGAPLPLSYSTSVIFSKAYNEMGFMDRVLNVFAQSFWSLYTQQLLIARFLFNDPHRLKFLDDIQTTMLIENSHGFVDWPIPVTRARVRAGSFRNELPSSDVYSKELSDFLEEDFDGFIVFSMSTFVSDGRMPDDVISAFSEAFSRLPRHGFIWRINELPTQFQRKNIFVAKWIPQKKLVGDPRVVLLINHCGQNSFLEAIRGGVSILGIPQQGDQYVNAKRVAFFGLGSTLSKDELHADAIHRSISDILTNRTKENRSAVIRQMLLTEEEFGMGEDIKWWVLHKVRQSPTSYREWEIPKGQRLGIFVYHGVDLLLSIFVSILFPLLLLVFPAPISVSSSSKLYHPLIATQLAYSVV